MPQTALLQGFISILNFLIPCVFKETKLKKANFTTNKYQIFSVLIPLFYLPCYISNDMLLRTTKEDGFYENIGALFFLLTAITFFLLAAKPKRFLSENKRFKNIKRFYFMGLAFLFLFAFGEEISWGQRIFNYATPEALKKINAQEEFNIHNIQVFHGRTEDGVEKKGIFALFTMHRLFYIAFLTYLFIIPLLTKLNGNFKAFINKRGLPLPPIIFGILFCANWLFGNTLRAVLVNLKGHGIVEIKETVFALILFMLALYWVRFRSIKEKVS